MELNDKDITDLKQEIQHIFDSGANEIRIFEMVKMFTERRFVSRSTPLQEVVNTPTSKETIIKHLNEWVFGVETQAGEKLRVIDCTDFKEIAKELTEKINF
jgi:hypothetical protein